MLTSLKSEENYKKHEMKENDKVAFRTLYAGFSRVRLKVVESSESL